MHLSKDPATTSFARGNGIKARERLGLTNTSAFRTGEGVKYPKKKATGLRAH